MSDNGQNSSYESEENLDSQDIHISNEIEGEGMEILPEKETHNRFTSPIMTKFERAKILGIRAQQISRSAPVMVEYGDETDPVEIAKKELREKKTPLLVLRRLPDNTYEKWSVRELINFYD